MYLPAVDYDRTRASPVALVNFPGRDRAEKHTQKKLGVNATEPDTNSQDKLYLRFSGILIGKKSMHSSVKAHFCSTPHTDSVGAFYLYSAVIICTNILRA